MRAPATDSATAGSAGSGFGTGPVGGAGAYPAATPAVPPAVPSGEQLPPSVPVRSAAVGRRARRRGVILAVLVILVGGVVAFAGARLLTQHNLVLAVARNVPVGATISDSDITTADVVQDPSLSPIPASDRSGVVGMVAQTALARGTLLTRAQLGTGSGLTAGQQLVALPLKPGQFPGRGLEFGQRVLIVATAGSDGSAGAGNAGSGESGGSGSSGATGGSGSRTVGSGGGVAATVVDVGSANTATQVTVIDVRVAAANGVTVAQLAASGNLAVILLPSGR